MAKRKKKRGLSGSPEHHRKEAVYYVKEAAENMRDAAGWASEGKCARAFNAYSRALNDIGRMEAHEGESGGGVQQAKEDHRFTASWGNAKKNLIRSCMMKQPGEPAWATFQGLRGRRRRARR